VTLGVTLCVCVRQAAYAYIKYRLHAALVSAAKVMRCIQCSRLTVASMAQIQPDPAGAQIRHFVGEIRHPTHPILLREILSYVLIKLREIIIKLYPKMHSSLPQVQRIVLGGRCPPESTQGVYNAPSPDPTAERRKNEREKRK